jgi:hypothetical protein
MMWIKSRAWHPYAAGAAIGVLSWIAFLTLDHPLGITTGVARLVALIEGPHSESVPYLKKLLPAVNFELLLVVGVLLGAWLSATLSGDRDAAPASFRRRWLALLGGFLLMFGARLAGGCTSGHGISGCLQLAASGWLFFAVVFAVGVPVAFLLKRGEASHGR